MLCCFKQVFTERCVLLLKSRVNALKIKAKKVKFPGKKNSLSDTVLCKSLKARLISLYVVRKIGNGYICFNK